MARKKIYQTLEFRDIERIEMDGPFPGRRKTAWLGFGYYFWESFIDNAHWWGDSDEFNHEYVICEASIEYDNSRILDLVGNTKHIALFRKSLKAMEEKGIFDQDTNVQKVIAFMKKVLNNFNFDACRAHGFISKKPSNKYAQTIKFDTRDNKTQYLDLCPAIQICLYNPNNMNFSDYRIVYPEEYCDDLYA